MKIIYSQFYIIIYVFPLYTVAFKFGCNFTSGHKVNLFLKKITTYIHNETNAMFLPILMSSYIYVSTKISHYIHSINICIILNQDFCYFVMTIFCSIMQWSSLFLKMTHSGIMSTWVKLLTMSTASITAPYLLIRSSTTFSSLFFTATCSGVWKVNKIDDLYSKCAVPSNQLNRKNVSKSPNKFTLVCIVWLLQSNCIST